MNTDYDHGTETELVKVKWTKLTLSGPPGSGKSSTLRLLLNEPPEPEHNSTPVMKTLLAKSKPEGRPWGKIDDLDQILSPSLFDDENETDCGPSDEHHFVCAIDTGGQAAFLDVAPAFLRYNSVNIVTHKLNEKLEDETSFFYSVEGKRIGEPIKRQLTNQQVLELSMRSLISIEPPEITGVKRVSKGKPNLLVLGTFDDKENREEPLKQKSDKLKKSLTGFNRDADLLQYGDKSIFPVNAIARGEEERKVASAIRRKACKSYIEAEIPKKWLKFQLELNNFKESQERPPVILEKSQCDEIGAELSMSPEDVRSALMFFHNLTIVLYFPKILPNIVFVDPQSLLDEVSELIMVSFADGANYFEEKEIDLPATAHDDLKNKGLFTEELLKTEGFMDTYDHQADNFLKLLENLQIVTRMPIEDKTKYFLPCVLPNTSDDHLKKLRNEYKSDVNPLALRWDGRSIPQGLFCALVLQLLQWKIFEGFLENERFRNAIQLSGKLLGGPLLLIDSVTHLEVYYKGDPKNCYNITEMIFEQLSRAVRRFHYKPHLSKPEKCFIAECSCVAAVNREETRLQCNQHPGSNRAINDREIPWLRKSCSISALDEQRPTLSELLKHFSDIPDQMHTLGILLELPSHKLGYIFEQTSNPNIQCMEVFKMWLEESLNPTRQQIIDALKQLGLNRQAYEYKLKCEEQAKDDVRLGLSIDDNDFTVDKIVEYLNQSHFRKHQWFELGRRLGLSEAVLCEEIENKHNSSSVCLSECLSLWLRDEKGAKSCQALASALEFDDEGKVIAKHIRDCIKNRLPKKNPIVKEKPIAKETPQPLTVDSIIKFLTDENGFKPRNWPDLGEKLGLDEDSLDGIKYDSSIRCLRECLLMWLEKTEGTDDQKMQSLCKALGLKYNRKPPPDAGQKTIVTERIVHLTSCEKGCLVLLSFLIVCGIFVLTVYLFMSNSLHQFYDVIAFNIFD